MSKINHVDLERVIKHSYETKIPLFCWGATGVGKSMTVKKVSEEIAGNLGKKFMTEATNSELDFCFIDIRVSQLDPSDLRGLPTINAEKSMTIWLPPNWLPRTGFGIIFFDELNLSPPSIQASCYQLILDRRLGDYKLPDGYLVIAAGNRLEDKANVFEMSAPLCNRFTHYELKVPNSQEWTDWALKNNIDARIVSFINFAPSNLFKFDSNFKDKAFPTPRTLEKCSRLISGVSDDKFMYILISGSVGEAFSVQFLAFLKMQEKFDLDKILEDPETVKLPDEISLLYCLIGSLVTRYKENKKLLKTLCILSKRLQPEFAFLLLRMAKSIDKKYFETNVVKIKEFEKERYSKYLMPS